MTSLYIWQYFLIVPEEQVQAADLVSPYLSNPDGIESTFQPYPEDEETPTHWVANFLATELNSEGNPSKEILESYLSETPELLGILWVRTKNPYHPNTVETEKGKVVATNWNVFNVGNTVDLSTIMENLS